MQKTKLCSETKILLGTDAFHKIPSPLLTRKFRLNHRKSIISRDIYRKQNYGPKSITFWGLLLLYKIPLGMVTRKFRQNRRKTIISGDMCRKRNQGPK